MKTLIIEDHAETAAFIAAGLRSRGHQPMFAWDGHEGFEIAAHETFDVTILDVSIIKRASVRNWRRI